jgi:hypothetical protein
MTFPFEVVKLTPCRLATMARRASSHASIYLSAFTVLIKESEVAC